MKRGENVQIEYIRPGKYATIYQEDFLSLDESCLRTHKVLPEDVSVALGEALFSQALVAAGERVGIIDKTYFFEEPFNLLEFRRADGSLLGYYSDIGEPVIQLGKGQFQMTDLFLDVWLFPDGQLLELDWDEFEEAVREQIISALQNLCKSVHGRSLFGSCFIERCLKPGLTCSPQA